MIETLLLVVLLLVLFYVLYINGFMIWNNRTALMFIGSIRGNGNCKARFSVCTGLMKRVMRFKESRVYHFSIDLRINEGSLLVKLLDKDKNVVMVLDEYHKEFDVLVENKKRYYLVFEFKRASGEYILEWK